MKDDICHKRILEILDYNFISGDFIWKKRSPKDFKSGNTSKESNCKGWNKKYAGKIAGSIRKKDGYLEINVDGRSYLAHRLAFFYYYGYFPENDIDHINRTKHDNRIANLREASKQCNARNTGMISTNTSGVKGVGLYKKSKKFRAYIKVNNIHINLGKYDSFANAVLARWEGEQEHNFSNCKSDSSAYEWLLNTFGEKLDIVFEEYKNNKNDLLSNNTSGVKGVTFDKNKNKWCSFLCKEKNKINIGRFSNFNDAVMARWKCEVKCEIHNCITTSSAYLYLKNLSLI